MTTARISPWIENETEVLAMPRADDLQPRCGLIRCPRDWNF